MSDEIVKAPSTEQVLNSAMQAHLQALAQKPITAASLIELQKTSILARKLLEMQQPKDKLMRRLANPNMGGGLIGGMNYDFDPELADAGGSYLSAISPSPSVETFGASAIRELVSAFKDQRKPRIHLDELMTALDTAKAADNVKLAEKIQACIERMLEDIGGDDHDEHDVQDPLGTCTHHDCISPAAVGGVNGNLCLEHYDEASVKVCDELQAADAGG